MTGDPKERPSSLGATAESALAGLARLRDGIRLTAVALIASYQGVARLTSTSRDPEMMARESRRLERRVDSPAWPLYHDR